MQLALAHFTAVEGRIRRQAPAQRYGEAATARPDLRPAVAGVAEVPGVQVPVVMQLRPPGAQQVAVVVAQGLPAEAQVGQLVAQPLRLVAAVAVHVRITLLRERVATALPDKSSLPTPPRRLTLSPRTVTGRPLPALHRFTSKLGAPVVAAVEHILPAGIRAVAEQAVNMPLRRLVLPQGIPMPLLLAQAEQAGLLMMARLEVIPPSTQQQL